MAMAVATGKLESTEDVTADASGTWGCGAYWRVRWFQFEWDEYSIRSSIAAKESS